jgi:hypothetical protein
MTPIEEEIKVDEVEEEIKVDRAEEDIEVDRAEEEIKVDRETAALLAKVANADTENAFLLAKLAGVKAKSFRRFLVETGLDAEADAQLVLSGLESKVQQEGATASKFMSLINSVFELCKTKLVGNGWDRLLKEGHGLDIKQRTAAALACELARPGLTVNRSLAGFSDFAADGAKGIEPGSPARSLLYHALASPDVLNGIDGLRLGYFPTLADLEVVENYVFGARTPSLDELLARAGTEKLTVVVYAHEYRPAGQTCHGRHADMVYARTGVARVGNKSARYLAELRGFLPESDAGPFDICASPARYAAYLAVPKKGNAAELRPMRFRAERGEDDPPKPDWVPDDQRDFWVPVHKLFPGDECIQGVTIKDVTFTAHLVNDKLFRIHEVILGKKPPSTPPFRITEGIAKFSDNSNLGSGVLVPEPHPLVERARQPGKTKEFVTFRVPAGEKPFDTLNADSPAAPNASNGSGEFRGSPEYVHIRTMIQDGKEIDLNNLDDAELSRQLQKGGYDALHYVDYTADGWVEAAVQCPALKKDPRVDLNVVAAYALVTAPDFFPTCDQRQLTAWTASKGVPDSIRDQIWNVPPDTLADQRLAPNIQLANHPFAVNDFTITALVSLLGDVPSGLPPPVTPDAMRHSHLPDDAAGIFAPGWDVSRDWTDKHTGGKIVWHLAAYGLGSPFPEDAKLCAALSTFWPAVAPDANREMEPAVGNQSGTVSPLTDQEIGQVGGLPWDGVPGPQVVVEGGKEFAEYQSFRHVDYVRNALDGLFTIRLTGRVDAEEYEKRVLAAAFAYLALGFERTGAKIDPATLSKERLRWKMLSFQKVFQGTPELEQAKVDARVMLPGDVYRLEFFPAAKPKLVPGDFRKQRIEITKRYLLFVDPASREAAAREKSQMTWHEGQFVV